MIKTFFHIYVYFQRRQLQKSFIQSIFFCLISVNKSEYIRSCFCTENMLCTRTKTCKAIVKEKSHDLFIPISYVLETFVIYDDKCYQYIIIDCMKTCIHRSVKTIVTNINENIDYLL